MYCRICGAIENANLRGGRRGVLCDSCAADTPRKASRAAFEAAYWGRDVDSVPESIRAEFYSDYRASICTLPEYIKQTTSAIA